MPAASVVVASERIRAARQHGSAAHSSVRAPQRWLHALPSAPSSQPARPPSCTAHPVAHTSPETRDPRASLLHAAAQYTPCTTTRACRDIKFLFGLRHNFFSRPKKISYGRPAELLAKKNYLRPAGPAVREKKLFTAGWRSCPRKKIIYGRPAERSRKKLFTDWNRAWSCP